LANINLAITTEKACTQCMILLQEAQGCSGKLFLHMCNNSHFQWYLELLNWLATGL